MGSIKITNVSSEETFTFQVGTIAPPPSTRGYATTVDGVRYFVNTLSTNGPFYISTAEEFEGIKLPTGTYHVGGTDARNTINLSITSNQSENRESFSFTALKVGETTLTGGTETGGSYINFPVYAFAQWTEGSNSYIGLFSGHKTNEEQSPSTVAMFLVAGVSTKFFDEARLIPYEPTDNGAAEGAGDPTGSGGIGTGLPRGNPAGVPTTKGTNFPLGAGMNAYVLTGNQLSTFMGYLWGKIDTVFADGGLWKKFQNYKFNPIAGVISCHQLPLAVMPNSAGAASISIAGTVLAEATGAVISNQWQRWNADTILIDDVLAMFAQYASSSIAIHLPFCGVVPVDVSACVGKGCTLGVTYWCDCFTGNVAAHIWAKTPSDAANGGVTQLLKVATGNAAYRIPLTGNDNGAGEIINGLKTAVSSGLSGNAGGLIGAGVSLLSGSEQHHTEVVGSINGNAGWCGSDEVFIIANWAAPIYTTNFDSIRGRPSEVSGTVSSFSGYCELEVHADGIGTATDEEKREIERICISGIII